MTNEMTAAEPWLRALDSSSKRLHSIVQDLSYEQLSQPSFAKDWSVAQVLSHLGSAAEICTTLIHRAVEDEATGPQRDELLPVWDRWNGMTPEAQREGWYEADALHRKALRALVALDPSRVESLRIPYFAGPLTVTQYAGYRLSEQSLHGWDVAVALDPSAVVSEPELSLLWSRIDLIATRFRDAATLERLNPRQISVKLTDFGRTLRLELGEELHLVPTELGGAYDTLGTVSGSADAVLRLIYGRNRPADQIQTTGGISLDDLRALFPGF